MTIVLIFTGHWLLSVFFQSSFQHRYAAHRMFTMSPLTERVFHMLVYLVQGSSYLSPKTKKGTATKGVPGRSVTKNSGVGSTKSTGRRRT